jgi:single-stranded-DNA-specific exonuclease
MSATLDGVNRQRQQVESSMLNAALEAAEAQLAAGHAALLVAGADWHPGVVGIVAGRIKELFNRPALVAGIADGLAKGSGRSVPGLDLGAAIIAARQRGMLKAGGGHAMAAGFTVAAEALGALHAHLDERLAAAADLPGAAEMLLDGALTARGATPDAAEALSRLGPFGAGHDEPVLALTRVRVVKASLVGKAGTTLRAFVEGEDGGRVKALCFRARETPLEAALLRPGSPMHLCGTLKPDSWGDTPGASFMIQDIAPA